MKEGLSKAHQFRKYCNRSSTFPVQEMWKYKNKVWPKKALAVPVAKRNHKGRLVSTPKELMQTLLKEYKERLRTPKELMQTLLKEYKERLRTRSTRKDLKEHMSKVHEVSQLKLRRSLQNKSLPFSMAEFEQGINDLNTGRARGPSGLCAELFHLGVMGQDLKISLYRLLN